MKAVRLHEYHRWPTLDEIPEPQITGPLDVIIRIGGAGLCRTDLHIWEGQWAPKTEIELPYTIGHENAGWVEAVGSAVSNVEVGDAVIVHPLVTCGLCRACRDGDDMHCENGAFPGIDTDGGWAEMLKTSARSVVKLPDGVEPADVAAHADAGLTAYHAVKKAVLRGMLLPGTTAVVIGAGGLGHIGIQSLAALCPADIVVVDRSEAALELARACGATHTVRADGSHIDTVLEMTDGNGAEAVFDFVGEHGTVAEAFAMTRRAGSQFVIGYGENIDMPTIDVISTERSFVGNLVGTYNDLAELMILASQGKVTLHTRRFRLDDAVEAMQELHHGRLQGRGILVPA
ncbi:MAG: NAD(P)-dependent alcohol dehydrogenase [Nitriliruptoraceae bacterium]